MTGGHLSNGPEDGELTDPEVRRLIYEVVRERFLIVSNAHLADYWKARCDHDDKTRKSGISRVPSGPVDAYDPAELTAVYDVLVAQARKEVLAIRKLGLSE